jgi:hypothetical protein
MLSSDEVCLYSGCELSTSVLKRSIEYGQNLRSSSCLSTEDKRWVAEEVSSSGALRVVFDSAVALEMEMKTQG